MQQSLLVQTLAAFTTEERHELAGFVAGPPFNTGNHAAKIRELFTLLQERLDGKNSDNFEREQVFSALTGGKPFKSGYPDNLMSELMAIVRQYIAHREMRRLFSPSFEHLAMARFYRARGMEERAFQALNRANTDREKVSTETGNLLLMQYWLDRETFEQASHGDYRQGDLHLPATFTALTVHYGVSLLEMALSLHQQQRVVPTLKTVWPPFISGFRLLLRERDHFDQPALRLIDGALALLEETSEAPGQAIKQFLALFHQHEMALPFSIRKQLAAYVRIYCNTYANRNNGDLELSQMQIALYKEHLAKKWLYEDGKLTAITFTNLVTIGLRAGETEWVWQFLRTHEGKIGGKDAEALLQCGFANYHCYKEEWREADKRITALRQLPKIQDPALEKTTRLLETKLLVERHLKETTLPTHLKAFKVWLGRRDHDFTEDALLMSMNFIKITSGIATLCGPAAPKNQKKGLRKLLDQVEDPGFRVAERPWLIRKLTLLLES